MEIIVVDDGSTDGTRDLLKKVVEAVVDKVIYQNKNKGKGAALAKGVKAATGDLVIVQDADLEYDPKELTKLMKPFTKGRCDADVVYRSRYARSEYYMVKRFYHSAGNKLLTIMSNFFTDLTLTDMETC